MTSPLLVALCFFWLTACGTPLTPPSTPPASWALDVTVSHFVEWSEQTSSAPETTTIDVATGGSFTGSSFGSDYSFSIIEVRQGAILVRWSTAMRNLSDTVDGLVHQAVIPTGVPTEFETPSEDASTTIILTLRRR